MAEYTKIGRIRPDYADTWDASRSYTALEMVKSADSYHAYIAKQDVPAGTPLTNAEYWGEVLDVSDVIAESVAATNRANTAAANADAARESIQDDLNDLHDELRTKADGILCAAEGETITLTDSSDDPMRGLVLFGKTTYDGTPSPENPVTLVNKGEKGSIGVRVTGKNLVDEVTIFSDKFLRAAAEVVKGVTYTLSVNTTPDALYFSDENAASDYAMSSGSTSLTYTPDFTGPCTVLARYETGASLSYNLHLEVGAQATAYEPGKSAQSLTALTPNGLPGVPVSSGGNYTDADGQMWVCDEVDFERGVYAKRIGVRTFNGAEVWNMNDGTNPENNNYIYYTSVPDVGMGIALCDRLPYGMLVDKNFVAVTPDYGGVIYVRIKDYMVEDSLSAFKAALAQYPLTVIYPLATPIETPLTAEEIAAFRALHTNKPNTTIYNDAGAHMAVSYNADTKTYIDNKISELAAAIVNTNA